METRLCQMSVRKGVIITLEGCTEAGIITLEGCKGWHNIRRMEVVIIFDKVHEREEDLASQGYVYQLTFCSVDLMKNVIFHDTEDINCQLKITALNDKSIQP